MSHRHDSDPDRQPATPEQGDLFAQPVEQDDAGLTRTERFIRFAQLNPHVEELFIRELNRWQAEGRQKIGISLLISRARWVFTRLSTTGEEFKINDHHGAYYARKLMADHPRFEGMFNLRPSPEADAWLADYLGNDGEAA